MAEVTEERRDEGNRWLRELIGSLLDENNRRWRKILTSIAVGYLILVVGIAVALFVIEKRDSDRADKAIDVAHVLAVQNLRATLAECKRVNILRAGANRSAQVIFATLWTSAQRERALAVEGPDRKTHEASARALELLAARVRHTDLTNCHEAVFNARHYHAPQPQTFNPRTDSLVKEIR